jgi:sRNA-binding carbon storage regulator CsrA
MLVLTRRQDDKILIYKNGELVATLVVVRASSDIKIGIAADETVRIERGELKNILRD